MRLREPICVLCKNQNLSEEGFHDHAASIKCNVQVLLCSAGASRGLALVQSMMNMLA
jgi:hypothetical protein